MIWYVRQRVFFVSCILSIGIHALIFAFFFQQIDQRTENREKVVQTDSMRVESDSAAYKTSTSSDSVRLYDTLTLDSTLNAERLSENSSLFQFDSLLKAQVSLFQERSFFYDTSIQSHRTYYQSINGTDSMFGYSEYVRMMMAQRLMNYFKNHPLSSINQHELEALISSFMRNFQQSKDSILSYEQKEFKHALQDTQLLRLWNEAMLGSLWQKVMERVMDLIGEALGTVQSEWNKKGGSGSQEFGELFLSTLQELGSSNFSLFPSLFDTSLFFSTLAGFAHQKTQELYKRSVKNSQWIDSIQFQSIMKKAFASGKKDGFSERSRNDFLTTLQKGLGEDIEYYFQSGPTRFQLRQDPSYFDQWADDYCEFLNRFARQQNLLLPNLDAYAHAISKLRNRSVTTATIAFGKGMYTKESKEHFFSPEKLYVAVPLQDTLQATVSHELLKNDFYAHAWGGAVRSERPIVIDGDLSEWNECKKYSLKGTVQGTQTVSDEIRACGSLRVQWDNQGLYFAYYLFDRQDNPPNREVFWASDAFELFFDPHNAKDSVRIEGRSFQYWIWPRSMSGSASTGQSVFKTALTYEPKLLKQGIIKHASKRTGTSYTVEVFVPAFLLGVFYPLPGKIIGFNYSINNGEGVLMRWVTNKGLHESTHPNLWGDLVLMGSDGMVQNTPNLCILPGQNLLITIHDKDMDLKNREKDKIWATVSSEMTGDHIPVHLVETDVSSGIFTATIGTVYSNKPKLQNALSILLGDVITIYYLDQFASGDVRNKPLYKKIHVPRAVFSLK